MINHGRNWQLLAEELPQRTLLQIQVRTKLIFSKIEKEIPKGANNIEFIKEKGIDWFESKEISNKFKFDNEDYDAEDPPDKEPQPSNRNRSRNRHTKEASNITLRARPPQKSSQDSSEKKKKSKQSKKPSRRDRERRKNEKESELEEAESSENKEAVSKSDSIPNAIEEPPSETRFTSAIRVIPRLRSNEPSTASTELYKIPPPPATILPFNTIGDALNKLVTDLTNFEHRLENDYAQRAPQLDNNSEIGEYWRGLKDCSVSLLHIVNDIALLHQHNEIMRKNTMMMQDLPMYSQQMYPMGYSEHKASQYQLPNN